MMLEHETIQGTGVLLPYQIKGEPPEAYARRCELYPQRNRSCSEPNEAELEYKKIWNHWVSIYWENQPK